MRKRLWLCLLAAALIAGLVPAVAGALIGSTPFVAAPVAIARYGQVQPSISWPWMVYKTEQSKETSIGDDDWEPYTDIYAANLVTGEIKPVCTVPGEQSNPDISGTKVVYSDNRNNPLMGTSGYCNIYMTDLATGVESVVCSMPGGQGNPSIDGNVVVWTDGREGGDGTAGGDIYMKDLSTGIESAVATSVDLNLYEPTTGNGYISWLEYSNYKVMLYNIASKVTTEIADSDTYGADPCIADGYLVYINHAAGVYTVNLYNLTTKTTTVVASSTSRFRHAEVGGGWVTWHDNNWDVWGYHIKSGVARRLVACTVDAQGDDTYAGRTTVAPTNVAGRAVVVWHDHRNESIPGSTTLNPDGVDYDDLYGMYLTDVFGPVITVAGVEDETEYTEGVKPVVTCDEGCAVTTKITCNGVVVSNGTTLTAEGVYQLVATARDSLGNPGRVQVDFTINNDEAPAGTMKLCAGADVVNTRALTIDSAMTDCNDITMRYSLDGGSWVNVLDEDSNPTYEAKVAVEVEDEGFHDVLVEYTDADGNVASRWDWVYVVTSPAAATLGTVRSSSTVTHGKTFTVSGTFAPTHIGSGVVRVYKYKYVSGKWKSYGYTNVAITATGDGYSGRISLPSAGKWRLKAYHKDAGHSASWTRYAKSVTAK